MVQKHGYFSLTDVRRHRLLNYTPIATVVRLTAIALVNMYLTGVTVTLFVAVLGKGAADFHLAAWLAISAGLTVAHRVTLRRIDIRKDTSASFAVVSVASFISAVVLTIEVLIYSTMLVGPSTGGREESVFMG